MNVNRLSRQNDVLYTTWFRIDYHSYYLYNLSTCIGREVRDVIHIGHLYSWQPLQTFQMGHKFHKIFLPFYCGEC